MMQGVRLNALNQQMKNFFPAEFAGLYRIANIEQQSLRIEVANAMVRQKLLFRQQALLGVIQRHCRKSTNSFFILILNFVLRHKSAVSFFRCFYGDEMKIGS